MSFSCSCSIGCLVQQNTDHLKASLKRWIDFQLWSPIACTASDTGRSDDWQHVEIWIGEGSGYKFMLQYIIFISMGFSQDVFTSTVCHWSNLHRTDTSISIGLLVKAGPWPPARAPSEWQKNSKDGRDVSCRKMSIVGGTLKWSGPRRCQRHLILVSARGFWQHASPPPGIWKQRMQFLHSRCCTGNLGWWGMKN